MADKKKSGIGVVPEFVAGEQPDADKFNAISVQAKRGLYELEKALGDILSESYPYTADSNGTYLTIPWGRGQGNTVLGAETRGRPLGTVNLARLIGPASNLNPMILGHLNSGSGENTITGEDVTQGGHQHTLRYLPDATVDVSTDSSGRYVEFYDSTSAVDTSIFSNLVTDVEAIDEAGDYYIDSSTGRIYTYSEIDAGMSCKYAIDPNEWFGGPTYLGSSFNEIPDPNQTQADSTKGVTVSSIDADGLHTITLPVIEYQQANYNSTNDLLDEEHDPNYYVQLQLPSVLTGGDFVTGDTIPEGFIYLKNNSVNVVYTDATYYYNDEDTLQVGGIDLTDDLTDSFSILTIGTDITTSIDDLRRKLFTHSHDRRYGGSLVDVADLDNVTKHAGESGVFVPSEQASNYFPQYLHRDGWQAGTGSTDEDGPIDDNANDQNCMRGDLVVGCKFSDVYVDPSTGNQTPTIPGGYIIDEGDAPGETFKLRFGYTNAAGAPYIFKGLAAQSDGSWTTDDVGTSNSLSLVNTSGDGGIQLYTGDGDGPISIVSGQTSGTGALIYANADIGITSGGNTYINTASNKDVVVTLDGLSTATPEEKGMFIVAGKRQGDHTHIVKFDNQSTSASGPDILSLEFSGVTPDQSCNFITFYGISSLICGAIEGGESGDNAFMTREADGTFAQRAMETDDDLWEVILEGICWAAGASSVLGGLIMLISGITCSEIEPDHMETQYDGAARFVSGFADFGEWLPIGDFEEWEEDIDTYLEGIEQRGRWGLEEGRVIYVREGRIYRYGPGTPMLITNRAMCIGNASTKLIKTLSTEEGAYGNAISTFKRRLDDGLAEGKITSSQHEQAMQELYADELKDTVLKTTFAGEVVSFIGQLPALVKGDAEEGDYIIPVDGEPYCIAKNADEVTFQEYKKVLGTVWEKIDRDEGEEFIKPLCAIGRK